MEQICDKSSCTGCMACYNVCTHNAISIAADEEGFERPEIDKSRCVDCGMCVKVCPINNPVTRNNPIKVFSGWSKDESIRESSSSGGAFTEIARIILNQGGIVYGCALNDKLKAVHTSVDNISDLRRKLSGSKYVQSHLGDCYKQVKSSLQSGKKVLFSGSPCQVAGLRSFLRKEYPNLITVDLICHGVPSPQIFENYKLYMSEKLKMSISSIGFRCKKSSWIFFNMTLKGHVEKNGRIRKYNGCYFEDPYIRGFLRDYFLRPSCYQCRFTSINRASDITIADWWGYKGTSDLDKGFRYKGVSLVLINSTKGIEIAKNLNMHLKGRTLNEALKTNKSLSKPFEMPKERSQFWQDYHNMDFASLVKKYMFPEKVGPDKFLLQHFRNTDLLMRIAFIFSLPRRVKNKINKIIKENRKMKTNVLKWPYRKCINLVTRLYSRNRRKALQNKIENKKGKTLYLFCAPTHSNLGDQAQLMCWIRLFKEWYKDYEIVLVSTRYRQFKTIRSIHERLTDEDLIFVHSGYLMFDPHHELVFILDVLRAFYDHHVVILPQTVNIMGDWYRHIISQTYDLHPDLTLLCRDKVSLEKAKELFHNVDLKAVPDVVTILIGNKDFQYNNIKKNGVLLCVRNDMEKFYTDEQIKNLKQRLKGNRVDICDTTIKANIWEWDKNREKLIRKMLRKMASYQVVITDRFHGTIFAQIVNTPTIVISSTDHKLSSGVKWFPQDVFGGNISFANTLEEAYEMANVILARGGAVMQNPPYFKEKYYDNSCKELFINRLTHTGGGKLVLSYLKAA